LLIVTDIPQLKRLPKTRSSKDYLRSRLEEDIVNIQLDYRYMKIGYYVSMHAEALGSKVIPTSIDIIDSYNNAAFLARAENIGIPTSNRITTDNIEEILGRIEFPIILFPLNPFSYDTYRITKSEEELFEGMKSLGMNFRYPLSAQSFTGELKEMKTIFGYTEMEGYNSIATKFFEEFRIPLIKLYIQADGKKHYLSAAAPLKQSDLENWVIKTIEEKIEELRNIR